MRKISGVKLDEIKALRTAEVPGSNPGGPTTSQLASHEIAALLGYKDLLPNLAELMERIEKGVKKGLLPLTRLEGIGRVRARILYNAGLQTISGLKTVPLDKLGSLPLIGP